MGKNIRHVQKYPDRKNFQTKAKLIEVKGVAFLDENGKINLNGFGVSIPAEEMLYADYELLKTGLKDKPELITNYLRPASAVGWFDFDDRAKDKDRGKFLAGIYTSKGCVARCTFCQRSTKGYRTNPLEHLDNHLKYLKENFNVGHIIVLDENFGSNKKQAYQIADTFKKNNLLWMACGVRCTSTTDEDVKYYKESGCCMLKYGIETGSQKILDLMEKVVKIEDNYNALMACNRHEIHSPINILVGMPGEDETTTQETGHFLGKVAAKVGVHPRWLQSETSYALPLPGTPLWEYGEQMGIIGKETKDQIEFLTRVADAGTYKRYYINLNGAPISEVLFWEYLVKLEASRTFWEELGSPKNMNKKLNEKYIAQYQKIKANNPNQTLKYNALKFTFISYIIDHYIVGNKFVDKLPRKIVYPTVKYLLYFEYLIQKMFPSNRKNNIFIKTKKIPRVTFDMVTDEKNVKKKSLRTFVSKQRRPIRDLNGIEKVRHDLRVGL